MAEMSAIEELAVGSRGRRQPRFGSSRPGSSGRGWPSVRWAWFGFAGLLVCGAIVAVSAGRTDWLLPASVRPVPGWLAGVFGHSGIDLELGGLIAVSGLMFVSYAMAIRAADQLSPRALLLGVASLNVLVLLAPPLLSTDIFSYVAYGRIGALYGGNPYLHGPSVIALDPSYAFIPARWVTTPTVYGPLFTAVSYLLAPLGVAWNVIAYKGIAAISSLMIVLVVWHAAPLRGLDPVKAVAVVGLNPVIVLYGVGGGHNDMLMVAILLTGVYVLLRQKERTSGALIVAATAVKITAGLLLPFVLAHTARERGGRGSRAVLTGAGVAAVLAGILTFVVFGSGPLNLVSTLEKVQAGGGLNSVSGVLLTPLGLADLRTPVGLVLDAGFAIWLAWLVRRVWIGKLDWITGAGWATVALLLTAGLLLPWYVAWLVPLAALSTDRRLLVAAVMLTGLGLTTL